MAFAGRAKLRVMVRLRSINFVEYAFQTEYGNNPGEFDLSMFRAQANMSHNGITAGIGIENLEGNGSRGFATPLATLHAFQGWADVFLGTPASGLRDIYVRGSWNISSPPFGEALTIAAVLLP